MKKNRFACAVFLAGFSLFALSPVSAVAQNPAAPENPGTATLVVTAQGRGSHAVPQLQQNDVTVLVNKRPAQITGWEPYRGANDRLQLVFLFDESSRSYLALQFSSIRKFIDGLPPSAEVGIAYMNNGRAQFQQKLTSDHVLAGKALRLTNGIPGISASPYFCLSDLAKNWPSHAQTRRVVFMVTNGEDPYYRGRDLQDPYVAAAISDSQKAGLLAYSIYFRGVVGGGSRSIATLFGQSYLSRVADETGGTLYTEALSSPVSFDPFLKQFKTSLENQYQLTIAAQGSGLQRVSVKSNMQGVKLKAAARVDIGSGQ
jgi:hypothetical protein